MFQLAAPLGLIALGAVLAPILIHLARRPLRVVKLGSLRFLDSDRRRMRSFSWQQRILLILRCLLLTALALLLAGLFWKPAQPSGVRWLLRAPGALFDASAQSEWDRLRAEGYVEKSFFESGSRLASTDRSRDETSLDAWSFLREADARLPAGSRAVVFGPPLARYFGGIRPTLSQVEVDWQPTPAMTRASPPREPPPSSATIVAAANRLEDARYVEAMLTSLGTNIESETPRWIFVLGDVPVPPVLLDRVQQGAHLVTDAPDTSNARSVSRSFAAGDRSVLIHQRTAALEGSPLLLDSAGEALLTTSFLGHGTHRRFAMRFHPDWTDWPLSSAFPIWWRRHLVPENPAAALIAPEQAAPKFVAADQAPRSRPADFSQVDWRFPCWMVAALLFALERGLSRSVKPEEAMR